MRRAVLLPAAVLLLPTACAPARPLPPGVGVEVYQSRSDVPARKLELRVTNASGSDLRVTRAVLVSGQLADPATWDGSTVVPAGQVVDQKVALPAASCASAAEPRGEVTLAYVTADGGTGEAAVVPGDPIGQLPGLTDDECLARAVAGVVTIAPAPVVAVPGRRRPATLTLRLTPTGAPGSVTVERVLPTVLLALSDARGHVVDDVTAGITAGAGSPARDVRVRLIPARCDLHALADDKRGTQFPLQVAVSDGRSGRITVPMPGAVTSQLYRYVVAFCHGAGTATASLRSDGRGQLRAVVPHVVHVGAHRVGP